jgi:hypothetical protein
VIANTAQAAQGPSYAGRHAMGTRLAVQHAGSPFLEVRDLGPSEALVLLKEP